MKASIYVGHSLRQVWKPSFSMCMCAKRCSQTSEHNTLSPITFELLLKQFPSNVSYVFSVCCYAAIWIKDHFQHFSICMYVKTVAGQHTSQQYHVHQIIIFSFYYILDCQMLSSKASYSIFHTKCEHRQFFFLISNQNVPKNTIIGLLMQKHFVKF